RGWTSLCPAHDDHTPSLDVAAGRDGRVLLCCRSHGCSAAAIAQALGLTMQDLFEDDKAAAWTPFEDRITATYDYRDEGGKVLYQTVRIWAPPPKKKQFRQRRPDGKDKWVWNLQGVPCVLYRLPELLAADPSLPVFVVEGEKDVDNLVRCGLIATTNPM